MEKTVNNRLTPFLSKTKSLATLCKEVFISTYDKDMKIQLAESEKIPDTLLRQGIRSLLRNRLRDEYADQPEIWQNRHYEMIQELKNSPIAIETDKANEQHYEVPTEFFHLALGKNKKYSSAYFPVGCHNLDQAEDTMLDMYLQRGELEDGQNILELGCGWGSLTLWMAEKLPNAKITGISNSATQREYILGECKKRNLSNVEIITEDINALKLNKKFDRVVSIEMFEHVRNYQSLFNNIETWLKKNGKLFVHIFCHKNLLYPFEVKDSDDWMSKYFFSGGLMPSSDTFLFFQNSIKIKQRWHVDGTHYEKTSNAWLSNMDNNREAILAIFKECYPEGQAELWFQRWRLFFMACAELFGYKKGSEWLVAHYLFEKN